MRVEIRNVIRRQQCRANQARYRNRQRIHQSQLQQQVQHLQEELQGLRLKQQRLRFSEKINRSAWAIASEVFRLLECSFRSPWHMTSADEMMKDAETRQSLSVLQKSFTLDVAMGSLSGMDALLDQLRRYSLYFGEPHIQLKRVESMVPGVLTASARLSVTVSEFTLRRVFPHLEKPTTCNGHDRDAYRAVREKLLGQRLDCSCELVFLVDEETGRVERLETSVNLVESLFDVMKSVEGVVDVMEQALLTSECLVGNLVDANAEAK
ncbi:Bzip transcription factor [Phytophthora cinnamomi]|uniref:Bzip transcription factor n=1 Tax=Phytophthora cinnamomi TaxID=4785 RepID=UPI00355965BC|nr:Bzip transcription factor [Phytophthora cinnamomi]